MKAIAVIIAAAALTALWGYGNYRRAQESARKGWNLEPIVAAAMDLDAGTTLTASMVVQQVLPSQFATANVVRPERLGEVLGKRALIEIKKGDPLLTNELGK